MHAIFYDGLTARPRAVEVELAEEAILITGEAKATWPYAEIARLDGPAKPLRLTISHARGAPEPRLEITDEAFIAALRQRVTLDRHHTQATRQERHRFWLWGLAAAASCVLVITVLLPAIAERLALLVPANWEIRLGKEMDPQIRTAFGQELRIAPIPLAWRR